MRFEFEDYHEITDFERPLKKIISGVKVIEIGVYNRMYHAVAYVGRKTEPAVAKMIKKIEDKIWEEDKAMEEDTVVFFD